MEKSKLHTNILKKIECFLNCPTVQLSKGFSVIDFKASYDLVPALTKYPTVLHPVTLNFYFLFLLLLGAFALAFPALNFTYLTSCHSHFILIFTSSTSIYLLEKSLWNPTLFYFMILILTLILFVPLFACLCVFPFPFPVNRMWAPFHMLAS